jgi:hypothetical protein
MQLADAVEAIAVEAIAVDEGRPVYFVYNEWMGEGDVPEDVEHVRIDSSVRAIKRGAFYKRGRLRTVILNDELEEIGAVAFEYCTSLEEIVIPNNVRVIKDWAFADCTGLMAVTLSNGMEEMGAGVFLGCKSLREIVIPKNVRMFNDGAFNQCRGLEIERDAFRFCTSMEEIVIPNSVRAIKYRAFILCTGLTRVTLGDGLEEIGDEAFLCCRSLKEIIIPSTVKEIHDDAFKKCWKLTRVKFSDEIEQFVTCDAMRDWWNQGRGIKPLHTYFFLVRCGIPERLGRIRVQSWRANIFDMLRRIPTISKVKSVQSFFASIDSKLSFYEGLMDSSALLELLIWKSKIIDGFSLSNTLLTTEMKMQCRTDSIMMVNIIVPNVMSFLADRSRRPLARLQDYFVYHGWMEDGDIPRHVTHVRIDSSVRVIKDGAFYKCKLLKIVILNDGLEEIGKKAFYYCKSLEKIVIPNKVRVIKDSAFRRCRGLTTVILGEGLEEIGAGAFTTCISLREIIIPNAVRAIKDWAFCYCKGLKTVTLGDGLEEIGKGAFQYCTWLEEISIPPAVKEIHDIAFEYCSNLTRIKFCDEIEKFVSCDAMRDWWNQGIGKKSLRTYCFLVRCGIPERLGCVRVQSWSRAEIFHMLRIIPTIPDRCDGYDDYGCYYNVMNVEGMNAHFDALDARLTNYENIGPVVLFPDQYGLNKDIVLAILSFL